MLYFRSAAKHVVFGVEHQVEVEVELANSEASLSKYSQHTLSIDSATEGHR